MFQRLAPLARSALVRPSLASPLLRPSASALRCNAPTIARFAQPRCFLSTEAAAEPKPAEDERPKLVYEGAKNKIVSTLKRLSVANLGFALASAPILHYITSAHGASGKGVAMSSLVRVCSRSAQILIEFSAHPRFFFSRARSSSSLAAVRPPRSRGPPPRTCSGW